MIIYVVLWWGFVYACTKDVGSFIPNSLIPIFLVSEFDIEMAKLSLTPFYYRVLALNYILRLFDI